jgi:hypothetical protein
MRRIAAEAPVELIARTVAASLPLSLGPAGERRIAVLDGAGDWPRRAAARLADGADGVVVVGPRRSGADELGMLDSAAPVVLDWAYASNAVFDDLARWEPGEDGLIEVTAYVADRGGWEDAALELRLIARTVFHLPLEGPFVEMTGGWRLLGTAAVGEFRRTALLRIVPTAAHPPRLEIGWAGSTTRMNAHVPAPDIAQPAHVSVSDAQGEHVWPTRFESAHRTSARRLLAALEDERSPRDLGEFESAVVIERRQGR